MKNTKTYEHCYQGSVRETVAEFIDNSPLLNKYKDKEYYELEDSLVELIRTASEKPKTTDRKVRNTMFLVMFDWSTEDDCGIETFLYNDYDAAHKKFKGLVKDELDPEISWVGSRAVNKYGKVKKGYILNYTDSGIKNTDAYFRVMQDGNYNFHSCIDLIKKEIIL